MSKKDLSIVLGEYIIDDPKPFARGAFSQVYRCRKKNSSTYDYVAKEVDNKHDDIIAYEQKMIRALEEVDSKYVLRYKKIVEKGRATYFITRFCNYGDLDKHLVDIVFSNPWEAQLMIPNLVESISAIHEANIIHRDIKAANFFLHKSKKNGKLMAILGDFGFGKSEEGKKDVAVSTVVGTPVTMAPEVWNNESYSLPADVWSLGIVVYNLCFGSYPFDKDVKQKISDKKYSIPPFFSISGDCIKLIEHCLQEDPKRRPKSADIFKLYPGIKEDLKEQDLFFVKKEIPMRIDKMRLKDRLEELEKKDYKDPDPYLELISRGTKDRSNSTK